MSQRVLVTGAGGFIGSHLVEALYAENYEVVCFVRYNSRNDRGHLEKLDPQVMKAMRVVAGDLRDKDAVLDAMSGCDAVIHLGALISIPYSYVHPSETIETNVLGTLAACQAAMKCKVSRFVHTSTSEVYGTAQKIPIDEGHPLKAHSPYSASKIAADKIVESYHLSFGLPAITIRPFNTYGPRQSARAIIPTIICQLLSEREVRVGSTEPKRDFTFVRDTVGAFVSALRSSCFGETINLGSGKEISIGELIELIARQLQKKVEIRVEEERIRPQSSEVEELLSDPRKAQTLLGWRTSVSLSEGLRETISYIRQNLSEYQTTEYVI